MMKYEIHDVIVVGAGPAGSTAAYWLSKNNLKTLIIEKEKFPRYKTCGGGIPLKTQRLLPFDEYTAILSNAIGGIFAYQGKWLFTKEFDEQYAAFCNRSEFDLLLLQKAIEQGADLLEEVSAKEINIENDFVNIITQQGTFRARYLILANGANNRLLSSPKRKLKHFGYAVEAEIEQNETMKQYLAKSPVFDFGAIPYGYGWIFPKRDHISIGVFQTKHIKGKKISDYFNQYLMQNAWMGSPRIFRLQAHPIPLGHIKIKTAFPRCLLVGDAANLADPWLGEGIYYAIQSGKLAAQTVFKAIQKNNPSLLFDYENEIDIRFRRDFKFAKITSSALFSHPESFSYVFSYNKKIQQAMFDLIRGSLNFRGLFIKAFLNIPSFAIHYGKYLYLKNRLE